MRKLVDSLKYVPVAGVESTVALFAHELEWPKSHVRTPFVELPPSDELHAYPVVDEHEPALYTFILSNPLESTNSILGRDVQFA